MKQVLNPNNIDINPFYTPGPRPLRVSSVWSCEMQHTPQMKLDLWLIPSASKRQKSVLGPKLFARIWVCTMIVGKTIVHLADQFNGKSKTLSR